MEIDEVEGLLKHLLDANDFYIRARKKMDDLELWTDIRKAGYEGIVDTALFMEWILEQYAAQRER